MNNSSSKKIKPISFTQKIINYFNSGDSVTKNIDRGKYKPVQRKVIVSESDKTKLLKTILSTSDGNYQQPLTLESLLAYVGSVYQEQVSVREENRQILAMTPDLQKASDIVISSIMSPNDLQHNVLEITCEFEGDVSDDIRKKINNFLTTYVEEKLKLSRMFPIYLKNILYITGSEALLVIPYQIIQQLVYGKTNTLGKPKDKLSFEHLGEENNISNQTRLDYLEKDITINQYSSENIKKEINIKRCNNTIFNKSLHLLKELNIPETKQRQTLTAIIDNFMSTENVTITDKVGIAGVSKVLNGYSSENFNAQYNDVLSLPSTNYDDVIGEPIITRLSTAALAVLYAPGSPEEHLGYLCPLDENGLPISDEIAISDNGSRTNSFYGSNNMQFLANAFGQNTFNNNNGLFSSNANSDIILNIYQNILEEHVKTKTNELGLVGVGLGNNNTLFRYVFFRYLKQQRTRLLFIPKQYLTYMAFNYDKKNGCGVTTIEENKNVFKIRICVVMSRVISQMNNSIDRKKITIKTNELFNGNIDEAMYSVVERYVEKQFTGFSADPGAIAQQLIRNSISVKFEGGAQGGVDANSVDTEVESVDSGSNLVDGDLLDDVNKQCESLVMAPESSLNKTSEDEFATGIVSAQIMFQNKVKLLQATSSDMLSDVSVKLCLSSSYVRSEISKLLEPSIESSNKTLYNNVAIDQNSEMSTKRILSIIRNLRVNFPQPDTIPNKNQLDILATLNGSLSQIIDNLFPDELGGTDENIKENMPLIRAYTLSKALYQHATKLGIRLDTIPNVGELCVSDILQAKQQLENLSEAILQQKKALSTADDDDADSGFDNSSSAGWGNDDSSNDDDFDSGEDSDMDTEDELDDDKQSDGSNKKTSTEKESTDDSDNTTDET